MLKNYYIQNSHLHGLGLFATIGYNPRDTILDLKENIDYKKYVITDSPNLFELNLNIVNLPDGNLIGKIHKSDDLEIYYTNHSTNPNAFLTSDTKLIALKNIRGGEEITVNYRITTHPYDNNMWKKPFIEKKFRI